MRACWNCASAIAIKRTMEALNDLHHPVEVNTIAVLDMAPAQDFTDAGFDISPGAEPQWRDVAIDTPDGVISTEPPTIRCSHRVQSAPWPCPEYERLTELLRGGME